MQMFFLKNIVSIFIAALVFTAIAIGVMVMRSRAPAPEVKAPSAIHQDAPPASSASPAEGVNPSSEMAPQENENLAPPPAEFDPLETPSERIVEEWERLGIVPGGEEEKLFSFSEEPGNAGNQAPADMAPPPQADMTPPLPQQSDNAASVPQEGAGAPQEGTPLAKDNSQPIRGKAMASGAYHLLRKAALRFRANEDDSKSDKEDPTDPTSEGTGPHGKHKGGPKVVKLSAIPIIRMGESFPQQRENGFKIIKPLSSY